MADRSADLVAIMRDVLLESCFDDRERFLQMALEERADEEAGLVPGGHRVVSMRLKAKFDETAWISEHMRGLSYLFFLRRLVDEIESDWPAVQARLEEIHTRLVNQRGILCNATLAGGRTDLEANIAPLFGALPTGVYAEETWGASGDARDEGLTVPAQVNYVGKAANLFDFGYEFDGSAAVITRYLATTWLWDRVRVQGGAYGAFCDFDSFSGVLTYVSYRDPNLLETLEVYDRSGDFLRAYPINDEELTKAIIGMIGDLDVYQLPDAKGYTSLVRYLTGIDESYRQRIRDQILGTTAEDFEAFAAVLDQVGAAGRVAILGSAEAIEATREERGDWLESTKVL